MPPIKTFNPDAYDALQTQHPVARCHSTPSTVIGILFLESIELPLTGCIYTALLCK